MYTTSSVRKFLNASNSLILESNETTINRFTEMILEKYENIDRNELEQLAFTLKDEIAKDHLSNSLQKKKKREGPKRAPSAYNLFVKEQISKLKVEHPDTKYTELMVMASKLWNKQKEESK